MQHAGGNQIAIMSATSLLAMKHKLLVSSVKSVKHAGNLIIAHRGLTNTGITLLFCWAEFLLFALAWYIHRRRTRVLIDTSCNSGTSTLPTYYSNFIARQLYTQNYLKCRKSQYWPTGHEIAKEKINSLRIARSVNYRSRRDTELHPVFKAN